ncbi:MAG: MarR family transcriptional regulator [Akkermansiaceae bacterium]|nr:MarR family transcriptional regulator [Armatimonadota bacterium]
MPDDLSTAPWICLAVMRLGSRMAARFDEEFRAQGITQAQFRLLIAVYSEGGTTGIAPSVLADHLMIERATVSVLATRLIEQALLARSPGENRRTHRLTLTPAGRQLLGRVGPHAVTLSHETLAGMTPDDLQRMRAILEGLEAQIRVVTGQPSADINAHREGKQHDKN